MISEPINPLALAIAMDASFVARVFCGDVKKTTEIIKKAIQHPGYALVDIFQPCVTFNKVNTFKWFKENTYDLKDHDPHDHQQALQRAMEKEKLPLGIFYINDQKEAFEKRLTVHQDKTTDFIFRELNREKLQKLLLSKQS